MKSLTLATVQFTPAFKRKDENLARIQSLTTDLDADIIVLPELCTTGYLYLSREEVAEVAEPVDGPTADFFMDMARRLNAVIVAGFIECDNKRLYNSCLIAQPETQALRVYRKIHLFYKERYCFDSGDLGFFVIEDSARDLRLGSMICYDWRFPEAARILTLLGADVIACPSNLITDAWRVVMPARAIENKVYIAVANRAGIEKRGDDALLFKGNSTIYGYNGEALREAGPAGDEILQVEITPQKTRDKSFNPFNDVLKDRQPHHYGPLVDKKS